jgi:hypothetical protein
MLRICKEIRIFPVINLNGERSLFMDDLLSFLSTNFIPEIKDVSYEFQKGGNKMLVVKNKS